jgi:hypothetical protein
LLEWSSRLFGSLIFETFESVIHYLLELLQSLILYLLSLYFLLLRHDLIFSNFSLSTPFIFHFLNWFILLISFLFLIFFLFLLFFWSRFVWTILFLRLIRLWYCLLIFFIWLLSQSHKSGANYITLSTHFLQISKP